MDAETAALFDGKNLPDLVKDTYLKASISNNSVTHYYKESAGRNTIPRKEKWQIKERIGRGGYSVFTPFFVRSFGWFHANDNICIALEYFPLGDLGSYLREKPRLSEKDAKDIVYQVLEGLDIMHSEGFAHRDLKPENILLKSKPPSDTWSIRLTDFGLSKRITTVSGVTAQRGTEGYLSPEILFPRIATGYDLQSLPNKAVFASDIWSLGEITFRILSQGQPSFRFQSELLDYTESRRQFPIQKLDYYNASFQGKSFVLRIMAIPYDRRWTAKAAMLHDWMTIPDSSENKVEPTSNQPLLYDQKKRNTQMSTQTKDIESTRGWTSTASLSTAQTDKIPALDMKVALQSTNNTPIATTTETVAETPLPSVESDAVDSNSTTTQSSSLISTLPDQRITKKDTVYAFEQYELKQYPQFPITSVKNDGTSGLKRLPIEFPASILQQQAWIDGTSLAIFCADGCLYIEDMVSKSRKLKRRFDHSSVNAEVAFSSDARWIAICTAEKLVAYDIEDEEKSVAFNCVEANLRGFTFSKDNKLLACFVNQGRSSYSTILFWILKDQVHKTKMLKGSIVYLKFMHNSDELVAVTREGYVYFLDIDNGSEQRRYSGFKQISGAMLSQTDSHVSIQLNLSTRPKDTVAVLSISALKEKKNSAEFWRFSRSVVAMTKSSNTDYCAVYCKTTIFLVTYEYIQVYKSTTSFKKPIFEAAWPHDSIKYKIAVAADLSWLALTRNSQTISGFNMDMIEASFQLRKFLIFTNFAHYFAPDGKTVLSIRDNTHFWNPKERSALIWDVESGQIHAFLNDWAVDFTNICWSSNSDSFAITLKNRHVQIWNFVAGHWHESTKIAGEDILVSRSVFAPDLRFMAVSIVPNKDAMSSEDPKRLAQSSISQLRLHFLRNKGYWDDSTLKNSIICDMAFSSDGQRLVVLVLATLAQHNDHGSPLVSIRIYSIQNNGAQAVQADAFKLALPPSGDVVVLLLRTGEAEVSEITNIEPSQFASASIRQHIHSWLLTDQKAPRPSDVILSPDHASVVYQSHNHYQIVDLITFAPSTKLIEQEFWQLSSNYQSLKIHKLYAFKHWYYISVAKELGRIAPEENNITFLENPPREVKISHRNIQIKRIQLHDYEKLFEFLPLQLAERYEERGTVQKLFKTVRLNIT